MDTYRQNQSKYGQYALLPPHSRPGLWWGENAGDGDRPSSSSLPGASPIWSCWTSATPGRRLIDQDRWPTKVSVLSPLLQHPMAWLPVQSLDRVLVLELSSPIRSDLSSSCSNGSSTHVDHISSYIQSLCLYRRLYWITWRSPTLSLFGPRTLTWMCGSWFYLIPMVL